MLLRHVNLCKDLVLPAQPPVGSRTQLPVERIGPDGLAPLAERAFSSIVRYTSGNRFELTLDLADKATGQALAACFDALQQRGGGDLDEAGLRAVRESYKL